MSLFKRACVTIGVCVLAASGCNPAQSDRGHKERADRWNEFWGIGDGQHGPFGRTAGHMETWTVECNAYLGPRRREMADQMAASLKRVRELQADHVRVEHRDETSRVLYGKYPLKYVQAAVDRESHAKGDVIIKLSDAIKQDLRFIKALALDERYPFFSARPIPMPIKDVGPPEWDLRNARGVYTLHVGVTYARPRLHDYKQAAVDWVEVLRKDGHEAYFYHHPDKPRSDVCVGTFGEGALIDSGDGTTRYSNAVESLRRQGDFMYNLENARKVHRRARNPDTGRMERMANWSFLVKIPQRKSADDGW